MGTATRHRATAWRSQQAMASIWPADTERDCTGCRELFGAAAGERQGPAGGGPDRGDRVGWPPVVVLLVASFTVTAAVVGVLV